MTESSGYNDPGSYDAATIAAAYDRIVKTGYQQGFLNSLAVSQNTQPAMNVLVATGGAWVKGIWHLNPAVATMTIDAADATLDRVDLIVVRRSATTSTALAVLKGTAAASPVAPTLTKNIATTYEIPLASVLVAHGTTAITTAMISDLRLSADCGPAAGEFGFFTIDPATGNMVSGSKRITSLADPSANQDAETKKHVADTYAPLASPTISNPTFTGTMTISSATVGTTQSAGDNTTKIATTAFCHTLIATGTYNGNNTQNRGIAHGLGFKPKFVKITNSLYNRHFTMFYDMTAYLYEITGSTTIAKCTVTEADATYFYVGTASGDPYFGNQSGSTYNWVAFG